MDVIQAISCSLQIGYCMEVQRYGQRYGHRIAETSMQAALEGSRKSEGFAEQLNGEPNNQLWLLLKVIKQVNSLLPLLLLVPVLLLHLYPVLCLAASGAAACPRAHSCRGCNCYWNQKGKRCHSRRQKSIAAASATGAAITPL
jgi:hypothetical protein